MPPRKDKNTKKKCGLINQNNYRSVNAEIIAGKNAIVFSFWMLSKFPLQ